MKPAAAILALTAVLSLAPAAALAADVTTLQYKTSGAYRELERAEEAARDAERDAKEAARRVAQTREQLAEQERLAAEAKRKAEQAKQQEAQARARYQQAVEELNRAWDKGARNAPGARQ